MLQVRFAEVNRRALQELGITLFASKTAWVGRSTTGQFAAPNFDDSASSGSGSGSGSGPAVGSLTFSDYLNLFFFQRNQGWGFLVRALKQKGYFQSLAEPNLIAYNGQEASFLAGGEFPVPFVSGAAGTVSVTWKEFGVRLKFTPRIAGDMIRLHVHPEVSSLDFNNGITISGFRIPALTTRRAETEVELRDGQSFAIAGLLNNSSQIGWVGHSDPKPSADCGFAVQEQGRSLRAHRAARARDAEARAAPRSRRSAGAAHQSEVIPAAGRR